MASILKGLVEMSCFSFHGIQILPISIVEGAVVDIVLGLTGRKGALRVALMGGFSASSNILVLRLLLLQNVPPLVIGLIFLLSFVSGCVAGYFGEYISKRASVLLYDK